MNLSSLKIITISALFILSSCILADNGKPDLWKVEKEGNISYLFGSIHLGSDDMYPLSEVVSKAYSSTDNLVVEIDLKPKDEMKLIPLIQKYGLNPSVPLEKRLSEKTLAIYKKACVEKALPCEQFAPLKVWLLSVQLSVMKMQQLGYKEDLGIDKYFLAKAHKSNKNVISLESASAQIEMLASFNSTQQELMLVQSLQATDEDFIRLFNAWKTGDDNDMMAMFHKDMDKTGAKEMYKVILDDRNITMVEKILENIAAKKSLFVVVGAGHVVGDKGIVNLLKKEGFKLTQVQ